MALGIPEWKGASAVGEVDGWHRSASEILMVLQRKFNEVQQKEIVDRLRWVDVFFSESPLAHAARKSVMTTILCDMIRFPGYYAFNIIRAPTLIYKFGLFEFIRRAKNQVSEIPYNYKRNFKISQVFKKAIELIFKK